MRSHHRIATLALLALVLHTRTEAQGPPGTTQLAGSAKLAVRGCAAEREPNFASSVTLLADGSWTATDAQGEPFGGSWVAVGTTRRKLDLFFDEATETDLVATVVADVGLLCDAADVVVTSAVRKRFTLTLNRAGTKAKLVLRYVFKGRANNRSGSAGYRIWAKGPFAPAA